MPAKFVNLIQFFEFQIPLQLKMVGFISGSLYGDAVVFRIYLIDIAPDKEFLLRQIGDGDAGMMECHIFFCQQLFFAIKQVEAGAAEYQMHQPNDVIAFRQQGYADTEEEKEFNQPEKEVHPGQGFENIGPGKYQNNDVCRNQQQATEIKIIGMM